MSDAMELPDSWKTNSGMIDDIDVTVVEATFSFDAGYNNGQSLCLILQLDTGEGGELHKQLLSVGDGWEPAQGGEKAVRADGKAKRFNANSAYGRWLTEAAKCAGAALVNRGDTVEAKVWIGTQWHVETETTTTTFRGESEPRTFTRLLPTKFLGITGTLESAASDKPASNGATNGTGNIPAALKLSLIKLAKAHGTHEEFMMAALAPEVEVVGNIDAEALVMDDKFWLANHG